jgi:hypothetical protein
MGRISEMVVYLNSSPKDWQRGRINYYQFTHYLITPQAKKLRREHKFYANKENNEPYSTHPEHGESEDDGEIPNI